MEVDGNEINAGPSCCVFAPQGTAHEFQDIGATPGRILLMVQLAGLETFFTDLAGATGGMREPDLSVVIPIFHKNGLELLGPPLVARPQPVVTVENGR